MKIDRLIVCVILVILSYAVCGCEENPAEAEIISKSEPKVIKQGDDSHIILDEDLLVSNGQDKWLIKSGTKIYFREVE